MKNTSVRNIVITVFVILWTCVFHYESLRHFYLNPLFSQQLPKVKFLFPPAGWIMFFNVGEASGHVEVYGVKDEKPQLIDPHDIFRTRTIMFDNIHRNILSTVASRHQAKSFCRYLQYRFAYFDHFLVTVVYSPSIVDEPYKRFQEVRYECREEL